MSPRRDPYAFASVDPVYAEEIEARQETRAVKQVEARRSRDAAIELENILAATITIPSVPNGGLLELVGGGIDMSVTLDKLRDWLDIKLPEELLGLELGGVTAAGQRMYNGVWIEEGKVKYTYPNGNVRTLGYTPKAAKKKFRRKSRRKRWTTRDQKEMEWRAHIAAIAAGQASVAPF